MAYGFINFLFLFLSYISFIFSFSYSVFTDQFPLYHHWSPSPVFFFPFCLLSPLCSISKSPIGVGLVVGLWFPIVIQRGRKSLGCGFVNSDCDWCGSLGCGSLFYLESLIHYSLFSESPIRCSISEGFIDSFYIYYVQVSSPSSPWFFKIVI